jgi:hypothetical protein
MRPLVEEGAQRFGTEDKTDALGTLELCVHGGQSTAVEGMDGMARILGRTAQLAGNLRGTLSARSQVFSESGLTSENP